MWLIGLGFFLGGFGRSKRSNLLTVWQHLVGGFMWFCKINMATCRRKSQRNRSVGASFDLCGFVYIFWRLYSVLKKISKFSKNVILLIHTVNRDINILVKWCNVKLPFFEINKIAIFFQILVAFSEYVTS